MNCSLNTVAGLISAAIALLLGAIVLSYAWVAAAPLFIAAAMVATVSLYFIPHIKAALLAYAACRGPAGKCSLSLGINNLGQAAAVLSLVSFLAAGLLEIAALALLASWILAFLGVTAQAAVAALVTAGQFSCAIVILVLLGVLTNAWSFKSCMDKQRGDVGSGSGSVSLQ
jgi:hypothetical protein